MSEFIIRLLNVLAIFFATHVILFCGKCRGFALRPDRLHADLRSGGYRRDVCTYRERG